MKLIILAFAPILVILIYVYFRDKYEKEPIGLLLKTFFAGVLIVIPISLVEGYLSNFGSDLTGYASAGYTAFIVAAFTEEIFKFIALYLIIWKSKEFD